jgi:hypothetical protein
VFLTRQTTELSARGQDLLQLDYVRLAFDNFLKRPLLFKQGRCCRYLNLMEQNVCAVNPMDMGRQRIKIRHTDVEHTKLALGGAVKKFYLPADSICPCNDPDCDLGIRAGKIAAAHPGGFFRADNRHIVVNPLEVGRRIEAV